MTIEEYAAAHRPNESGGAAARRLGICPRKVLRWRKKLGLEVRLPGRGRKTSPELLAKIEECLGDGWPFSEIRRTYGVSYQTLERYFPGRAWTHRQTIEHANMMREFRRIAH